MCGGNNGAQVTRLHIYWLFNCFYKEPIDCFTTKSPFIKTKPPLIIVKAPATSPLKREYSSHSSNIFDLREQIVYKPLILFLKFLTFSSLGGTAGQPNCHSIRQVKCHFPWNTFEHIRKLNYYSYVIIIPTYGSLALLCSSIVQYCGDWSVSFHIAL